MVEKKQRLDLVKHKNEILNVLKTAVIQKAFLNRGYPFVHGWVFNVRTGELIDLRFDFHHKLKEIQEIYNLGITK